MGPTITLMLRRLCNYAWPMEQVDTWDPVGTDQTYDIEENGWKYKIEITNSFSLPG